MYDETAGGSALPAYDPGYAMEKIASDRRLHVPTVRERIAERLEGLKKMVAEHDALLALLDKNPGVEEVLNAMRKAGL